jgi:hypothetical protein
MMNLKKHRIVFLLCIFVCIILFFIGCENSLFSSFDEATRGTDPPMVSGDTRTNILRPTWSWQLPNDAVNVRYKLGDSESDTWITAGGTNTVSFTPLDDLEEGSYTLYVQTSNQHGVWSISGTFEIVVDITKPDIPIVSGPQGTVNQRPMWSWESDTEIEKYRIGFTDGSWIRQDLSSSFYIPDVGLSNGSYTLFVQSCDFAGNWSESGSYVIIVDTDIPVPESPVGVVNDVQPVFNWSLSSIPTAKYELQIAEDESFTVNLQIYTDIYDISYELSDPVNEDETYYWRVRIIDESGEEGVFGETVEITIPPTSLDIGIIIDIPFDADLSTQTSGTELTKGEDMLVNVTPDFVYDSVSWYLDSVLLDGEDESSIMIGADLPIGNYTLTAAVRSGSTVYTEDVTFSVRL